MGITFEPLDVTAELGLDSYPDRTVFQTVPWVRFVAESQRAEPIFLQVREENEPVGGFTGLIIRKLGLRILGSPFPGWTTSYMAFNLKEGVSRTEATRQVVQYAFKELGVVHVEFMDRLLTIDQLDRLGYPYRKFCNFEIDMRGTEDAILGAMKGSVRTSLRKAEKCGVTVQAAFDEQFADDYYAQLKEVFGKQSLAPTYGSHRVRALIKHLLPTGNLLLVRAFTGDGECAATGIYPAFNGTMYFWGGASWRKHQILQPNEAVHWFAMRYWKERGMTKCDMGGGGEYKRKYGGQEFQIPWFRRSKSPLIGLLRSAAQTAEGVRQRFKGRIRST